MLVYLAIVAFTVFVILYGQNRLMSAQIILLDLGGWLYTEIGFLPALGVEPRTGHPSQY